MSVESTRGRKFASFIRGEKLMFPVDLFSLNEVADVQPFSVTLERESKNAMVIFKDSPSVSNIHLAWICWSSHSLHSCIQL
jgi:hypothetical protein